MSRGIDSEKPNGAVSMMQVITNAIVGADPIEGSLTFWMTVGVCCVILMHHCIDRGRLEKIFGNVESWSS